MLANKELKDVLEKYNGEIECAVIGWFNDGVGKNDPNFILQAKNCDKVIILKQGYNEDELQEFWSKLQLNYDNDCGKQELFGVVWLKDGSWLERCEYDGAEWWEQKTLPRIPNSIKSESKKSSSELTLGLIAQKHRELLEMMNQFNRDCMPDGFVLVDTPDVGLIILNDTENCGIPLQAPIPESYLSKTCLTLQECEVLDYFT